MRFAKCKILRPPRGALGRAPVLRTPQGERKVAPVGPQNIKTSCNLHPTPPNVLIAARQTATFFLMKTDEKDMETDIKKLARAHAQAAIQVLVEIMTQPDAPAGARISAAKTLLERGFGKVTTQAAEPEDRKERLLRIERVIVDPKEPDSERYPGYTHPANDRLPSEEQAVLDQQDQDQAQRAPPDVGDYGDYHPSHHGRARPAHPTCHARESWMAGSGPGHGESMELERIVEHCIATDGGN